MTVPRFTRLEKWVPMVDSGGRPADQFQQLYQKNLEAIEEAFTSLGTQLTAITAAQAAAAAARREDARTSSYTSPGNALTAEDAGADAKIVIAAHTRIYPGADVNDLSILASEITGLAFSTLYYVYYDDTTLTDATPNFQATTAVATAQVGAAAGRHFVGEVTTPANGAAPTSGTGGITPSYGFPLP